MKHFAHYIKRIVIDPRDNHDSRDFPYAEFQPEDQGFVAPAYHSVSVNSGVASRVAVGDKIWLFSQLSSPWGILPPSLDGMIRVAEIDKNGRQAGRYRFSAAPDSKWHPLFCAANLIPDICTVNSEGKTRKLLHASTTAVGQALRFLREISDPRPLCYHAAQVENTPPDFVSYRIIDGTKSAFELTKHLMENKRAVFWDRWSLPRRLAERKENVGTEALDSHIKSVIQHSRVVWGVTSDLYAREGSYSLQEKELAIQLNKFRPYPPLGNL